MAIAGYTQGGTPVPQWWVGEVDKAKAFRRIRSHQDEWPRWRRWYRGEWDATTLPSNVYYKLIRTLIPRVYFRNPSVSITPSKPGVENYLLSKLIERADNKLYDTMGVKEQMKRAVQNGIMFGTGAMRLGYGAEFTPSPDALSTEAPDEGGRRLRNHVEYNDLVSANMPWALSAHPANFVVPRDCVSIHDARWCCFETFRSLEDVKADSRLSNTSNLGQGPSSSRLVARNQQQPRDGVCLWEIRDKKTGLVFVLAPYAENTNVEGKVLYVGEDELQLNGRLPLYPLIFNNDDECFWGIPDSQIIAPQQGEKNEIRTQLRNHRRIAIAKLLYQDGAVTPDELSKLIDGNANIAIKVKDINGVRELNLASIGQIMTILENTDALIDNEVQQLLGLGVNQFGEYAPGSADRSATEATIVAQATQIRVDERRDACADLMVNMTTDLNQIITTRWPTEIVLDIVGPAGVPVWISATREQLSEARYNLKVDPDSALPQTKALREQKATMLYQIGKENPLLQPEHLTQFWLHEMYGVDADWLLKQPLFNTSPERPMSMPQATQQFAQLPPPANPAAAAAAPGGNITTLGAAA
jgi:hypothetical protein